MRKKPMKTSEFFDAICEKLKEKKLYLDILDYSLADTIHDTELKDDDFSIGNNLDFGSSEGIYLGITIKRKVNTKPFIEEQHIGTFKTLNEDYESFVKMSKLLADFIWTTYDYLNEHEDDFSWEGYKITAFKENGNPVIYRYPKNKEDCLTQKEEMLTKYPKVSVTDYTTRKEEFFEKELH